jgi:hypothetical protein
LDAKEAWNETNRRGGIGSVGGNDRLPAVGIRPGQWRRGANLRFAQFNDGKAADEAVYKTRFGCHGPAKDRDFVFTRHSR